MGSVALTDSSGNRVTIREVGLRDGLQSIPQILSTENKKRWVAGAFAAGLTEIEATAMVPPRLLPQLADAEDMIRYAETLPGLTASVLVPNAKGAERACRLDADKINYVLSASERHNQANVRRSTKESLDEFGRVVVMSCARARKPVIVAGIATAFGCTIEGPVAQSKVLHLVERLLTLGADELIIADTVGYADPRAISEMFGAIRNVVGTGVTVAAHFHDTRGLGLANVVAALEAGISHFDASLGGIGGCPHAPGATGNIASEDLAFMCERMGLDTGIDLPTLIALRAEVAAMLPDVAMFGSIARAGLPRTEPAPISAAPTC